MIKDPRIEIVRRKSGYLVRVIGANGEQLSVSEVLTSRQAAFTNLYAQEFAWEAYESGQIRVQFKDERKKKGTPSPLNALSEFTLAVQRDMAASGALARPTRKRAKRKS